MVPESILQEAERLINGDRNKSYGHALDNFTNTADLLNVFLRAKLKTNLTAEDVAMIMVLLKLAREMNCHKRDNIVDGAGYLGCLEKVIDERARRIKEAQKTERMIEDSFKDEPSVGSEIGKALITHEPPSPANPSGTTPAYEGVLKSRKHLTDLGLGRCWCGYPKDGETMQEHP